MLFVLQGMFCITSRNRGIGRSLGSPLRGLTLIPPGQKTLSADRFESFDLAIIRCLCGLLMNGVGVEIQDSFPCGWRDEERQYVIATPEMLKAARRWMRLHQAEA